jgi:TP901 family phage tail tape measure protein
MAKALTIPTTFTAVDKFTATVRKMGSAVTKFSQKAVAGIAKVARAERKLRDSFNKGIGTIGKLGLAFSALTIGQTILSAQVEVEKNMQSLLAITGVTTEQFDAFKTEIDKVSKSQKIFAGETAKAFEVVGSAKPELLSNAEALSKVTEASIILSKATGEQLETSALSLTGTLNQFGLAATEANRVINVLAAGSQAGAAAVPLISESLKVFGTVAASMNVSVEQSVGLIETLAEKNIKGAEAGTKLRNVLTKMSTVQALPKAALKQLSKFGVDLKVVSNNALPISDRLKELSKISGDATAMFKVFGAENLVAGQILLENTKKVKEYTDLVTGTAVAHEQSAISSATLSSKYEELVASFKNATTSTNSNNKVLTIAKKVMGFLADNMDTVISVVITLTAVFAAFKIVMIAVNIAMAANPIGLIITGIGALIAVVVLLVTKWKDLVNWVKTSDNWFAKFIRGALTPIVFIFKTIGKIIDWVGEKWDKMTNWVRTSDSFFAKFLRATITPLINAFQKLGELWDRITGGPEKLTLQEQGVDTSQLTAEQLGISATVNPDAAVEKVRTERKREELKRIEERNSTLTIKGDTDKIDLQSTDNNIKLTPNLGF